MADAKISALPASTTPLAGTEVLPIVQSGVTKNVSVANLTAGRDVELGNIVTQGVGTAFAQLKLNSNATNGHSISWRTADSQRWNFNKSGAESGGNAGSNLSLFRYSDAGSYLGNPLTLNRATGNINIEGNIAPSAGKGIDFSANPNAGGMTSELLDDYEEGTWTPILQTDGTTNFTSVSYNSIRFGAYTKIGSMVHFELRIYTDSVTVDSANGNVVIGGLPFVSTNIVACSVGNSAAWNTNMPTSAQVGEYNSQPVISLFYQSSANGGRTALPVANVTTGSAGNLIYIAGTYFV